MERLHSWNSQVTQLFLRKWNVVTLNRDGWNITIREEIISKVTSIPIVGKKFYMDCKFSYANIEDFPSSRVRMRPWSNKKVKPISIPSVSRRSGILFCVLLYTTLLWMVEFLGFARTILGMTLRFPFYFIIILKWILVLMVWEIKLSPTLPSMVS